MNQLFPPQEVEYIIKRVKEIGKECGVPCYSIDVNFSRIQIGAIDEKTTVDITYYLSKGFGNVSVTNFFARKDIDKLLQELKEKIESI